MLFLKKKFDSLNKITFSVKSIWKMHVAWTRQLISILKKMEIKECVLVFCTTTKEESGEKTTTKN